jgi:hypothetical protein
MLKLACALIGVFSAFALGSAEGQTAPRLIERLQNAPTVALTPAAAAPPRFIVRAITLRADNETGPDWPGSDEIYAIFTLRPLDDVADAPDFFARTSVFEDFDTGERRSFRTLQTCLNSAVPTETGSHGMASAWDCHPQGDFGPLRFSVKLYEEDASEDDLIGEQTVQWSREELASALLEIGGGSEESIRIGGYTLTWRVERVS